MNVGKENESRKQRRKKTLEGRKQGRNHSVKERKIG